MTSTTTAQIPTELERHLGTPAAGEIVSTASYIEHGGKLVSPEAVAGLRSLRPALQRKIAGLEPASRLRRRLEVLAQYFDEIGGGTGPAALPHREITFALLYFLKGFDRIPDTLPEVGLVDDAMVVQVVIDRHSAVLQGHWKRLKRSWPDDL